MKKIIIALIILVSFSFVVDKTFTFKFTEGQINYHWNSLNGIKKIVDQSDLPHSQVVAITRAIDSLQKDMGANLKVDSVKTK